MRGDLGRDGAAAHGLAEGTQSAQSDGGARAGLARGGADAPMGVGRNGGAGVGIGAVG